MFIYKIITTYVICLTVLIPNFFNTCDQISFYEKWDKSFDIQVCTSRFYNFMSPCFKIPRLSSFFYQQIYFAVLKGESLFSLTCDGRWIRSVLFFFLFAWENCCLLRYKINERILIKWRISLITSLRLGVLVTSTATWKQP